MRRLPIPALVLASMLGACGQPRIAVTPGDEPEDAFLTQVVEAAAFTGLGLSLATDADGNPHLSYVALPAKAAPGASPAAVVPGDPVLPAVKHAHFVESVWARNAVADEQRLDEDTETAIALAPDGTHHVAWTSAAGILYSTNAGGSFSEPAAVTDADAVGLSMTTDGEGTPWIAFYAPGAGGPEDGTDLVRAATPDGDAWTVETAAEASIPVIDPEGAVVAGTGIGVTPDGVVIAYGTEGRTMLARDTGEAWESETADAGGGFGVSLAVDGDGNPHLAYLNEGGDVRHAHSIAGGAWETSEVGAGLTDGRAAIAVDDEGVHYVAYQTREGIALTSNAGGGFGALDVPGAEGGARPRVAVGAENAPMVSWFAPGATGVKISIRGLAEPLLAVPSAPPGAGSPGQPPPAECQPEGTELTLTAPPGALTGGFDKDCLAAPAGETFSVAFDNQDTAPHNFAIYTAKGGERLYTPDPALVNTGETATYEVEAIADAGQYFFQCDLHPTTMTGTFVVA